jgi:hypothetical protein
MSKDERLVMLITKEQKDKIKVESKKQNINEPEYVRQAIDFYATFDVHFLEKIYIHAEGQKIPMPIVIQQLLTSYLAQDYAFLEVFGKPTRAFARAFQHDEKGLIEGNDLSELVLKQTKEDIAGLREKLVESVQEEKSVRISKEEATIMGAGKAVMDQVKAEAKYTPMARAKATKP